MLNGLKKFASAVVALTIAFTFVGAFTRLSENQVNADTVTNSASITLSGKARMKYYGNKKGSFKSGVLTLGKKGKKKNVYSVSISLKNNTGYSGGIRYKVYLGKKGWTGWKTSGQKAGTSGKKYRIEGIKIELTGELAQHYSVVYNAYMQTFKGKQSWVNDGDTAGTPGEKKRLEQIQVKIVSRDHMGEQPMISYRMYRDKYKWAKKWSRNGEVAGVTSGAKQKHEGLQISVASSRYIGDIEYRVRGDGYSWTAWNTKNAKVGKYTKGKRIEEVQIRLTGELAEHYDIYYRTCVKNKGWLGWAKNGERSGTEKYKYYIMALQCIAVPKGSGEPGNVKNVKSKYTSSYLINGNATLKFADFKAEYKKSNTMLGIDVSKYQGNIDFKKVKAAGCDFVILRCYVRNNYYDKTKKKYVWCNAPDTKFETYYKAAKAAGLKIGVYFFTCDYTEENMRKYTRDMIAKCKLKDKQIDFPIAFDWENFDYYKRAHKSKKWSTSTMNKHIDEDLNKMVAIFEEEVENAGFAASIYGSKSRLEGTWSPSIKAMKQGKNHLSIWMAHWVTKSSYKGSYYMWQVNSHGRIPGISGDVDLDVAFTDRLPSPVSPVKPVEPADPGDENETKEPKEAMTPNEGAVTPEGDNGSGAPEEGNATPEDKETAPNEGNEPEEGNASADEKSKAPEDVAVKPDESEGSTDDKAPDGKAADEKPSDKPEEKTEDKTEDKPAEKADDSSSEAPAKDAEPEKEPAKADVTPAKGADSGKDDTSAKDAASEKKTEPEKDTVPAKEAQTKETSPKKETAATKPVTPSKEQPEEARTDEP